ncbi:MAG: hypothetical protein VSS75_005170 [Candidatus Parabeggiatoa sp.]|nr:hypothetical protein [Candidatus Parabeggiatoa sp.]
MNRLEKLRASIDNDPKIIATLPIEDVDALLDDMGVDITPFIEKELNFINGIKAKWQEEDKARNLFKEAKDKTTDLFSQFSQLIITLTMPALEEAVGGCADENAPEKSILSLSIGDDEALSNKTEDSSIMVYQDDEAWILSFRTLQPQLAGKSVLLVIKDSMGDVIKSETKLLENDDDVWEFEYALPKVLNLGQSLLIDIRGT